MKGLIAAIVALTASIGTARAQDFVAGFYDSRSAIGWTYHGVEGDVRVWLATDGSAAVDHPKCTLTPTVGIPTRHLWQNIYRLLSANDLAATTAPAGTALDPGFRVEHVIFADRPIIRFDMSGVIESKRIRIRAVRISGVEATLTLVCWVDEESYEARQPLLESFLSGVGILTTAPQ